MWGMCRHIIMVNMGKPMTQLIHIKINTPDQLTLVGEVCGRQHSTHNQIFFRAL